MGENSYTVNKTALSDGGWALVDEQSQALLNKLQAVGKPLGDYVEGKIYRGVLTGLMDAFVIDAETRKRIIKEDSKSVELIKPFLIGRDVKRFEKARSNKFLIFTRRGVDIKKYPAIERQLSSFKKELTPKPEGSKGGDAPGRKPGSYKWYEIQDTVNYYEEFEKPKIIYAEIATRGQFTLDTDSYYSETTTYIIPVDSKYLLGILNSKLITFIFAKISSEIRGGFYRWKRQYVETLPICTIDFNNPSEKAFHDKLVSLVDRMLDLYKRKVTLPPSAEREKIEREIAVTDEKIDEIVFGLYGVTNEEKQIMLGMSKNND